MRNELCVVIPHRKDSNAKITLQSLAKQQVPFDIFLSKDVDGRGQSWALNRGLAWVRHCGYGFVLFSDDDINWCEDSVATLLSTLTANPQASYSYGAYEMGGKVQCNVPFDSDRLRQVNYISTMSLVRVKDAVDFDETLVRLIDWDYWLTMLDHGRTGVYCDKLIFSTAVRMGVTESDKANNRIRKEAVALKHNIPLSWVL